MIRIISTNLIFLKLNNSSFAINWSWSTLTCCLFLLWTLKVIAQIIISYLQSISLCLISIAIFIDLIQCQRKVSPCPTVFSYDSESDTSDTWYGTLRLQTSVSLHSITVDVIFDRAASTFGAYSFNDVSTTDYREYRVENKNFVLEPGRTLVMNVYVRFNSQIPLLKQVRLNGQNICVDLPTGTAQAVHVSNGNSQTISPTKRTTRRENPNHKWVNLRKHSLINE